MGLPPHVMQRPERPRCEKRVTGAPQHPRRALPTREFLQKDGLADARFAGDERDAAAALGRGIEPFRQIRETQVPLEQFHSKTRERGGWC